MKNKHGNKIISDNSCIAVSNIIQILLTILWSSITFKVAFGQNF